MLWLPLQFPCVVQFKRRCPMPWLQEPCFEHVLPVSKISRSSNRVNTMRSPDSTIVPDNISGAVRTFINKNKALQTWPSTDKRAAVTTGHMQVPGDGLKIQDIASRSVCAHSDRGVLAVFRLYPPRGIGRQGGSGLGEKATQRPCRHGLSHRHPIAS